MSDGLSESSIVRTVARSSARLGARRTIAALQKMNQTLSGDDSELKTAWDDICVQVQYEESFFWDAYDEMVRSLVRAYVEQLPRHEQEALWLQTDEGRDWDCEEIEHREPYPVCVDDIVNYIARKHVYAKADQWSNPRIRAFLERSAMRH